MTVPAPQDGGVYVSSTTMYEEVRRVADGLIRLETKLDQMAASDRAATQRLDDHESRLRQLETSQSASADHEPRLASVERKVWLGTGIAVTLSAVIGYVSQLAHS